MIKTNDKEVINRMAKKSFKSNKGRNKFAVISIILTTLLFTSLFTIQMSSIKSSEYNTMRMVGTTYPGGFDELSTKEYEKLKDHKLIKDKAISVQVGLAGNKELIKRQTEIKYGDENYIKNCFASPQEGSIPVNKNDILIDDITLATLGIPKKLNEKVKIKCMTNQREFDYEFNVSGIYKGSKVNNSSILYVSKEFIKDELKDINQEQSRSEGYYTGEISLEVDFSNSLGIDKKLRKIANESGLKLKDSQIGVNWGCASTSVEEDKNAIYGVIGCIALIMISGYLIIYNVFYISIVKDIKFYGLLKTIGTTKKQINKIIKKQALILCGVGIPIGLLMGYFIGVALVPLIISNTTIEYAETSASPLIFIGSTIFSLITVMISTYKPAKIASKVSPVEATRYSGVTENRKRKIKKSSTGAKIRNMALSNVFRNKKKAFVVISSLSLSIILLNTVYTIVKGFDIDKFLSIRIGTDFTVGDASFYRWRYGLPGSENQDSLTETLCNDIEKLDGVKKVDKMFYTSFYIPLTEKINKNIHKNEGSMDKFQKISSRRMLEDKEVDVGCYGIDYDIVKMLEKFTVSGKIDIEKFKSGNYVILGEQCKVGEIVNVGDKITIPFDNGETKEYEVLDMVKYLPLYLYKAHFFTTIDTYLPINEFKNISKDESVMEAMFDVEDDKINSVKKYLDEKIETKPTLDYRMKLDYVNEFKDMAKTYEIVGYGLSFIVGVIGMLNFINVIVSNIISRKNEIAMLKSIGMTKKQIRKMVVLEGLYYAVATIIIVSTIGLPITYKLVDSVAGGMNIFSYKFTMTPILVSAPILIIISCIVPILSMKHISSDSIVEALRENQ